MSNSREPSPNNVWSRIFIAVRGTFFFSLFISNGPFVFIAPLRWGTRNKQPKKKMWKEKKKKKRPSARLDTMRILNDNNLFPFILVCCREPEGPNVRKFADLTAAAAMETRQYEMRLVASHILLVVRSHWVFAVAKCRGCESGMENRSSYIYK